MTISKGEIGLTYNVGFRLCDCAELHLPSTPTAAESPPPPAEPEDDGEDESMGSENENFVPVEESAGTGTVPGGDDRLTNEQQRHHYSSTKKPPQTIHGGNGRHHDNNKHRHGGAKGTGFRRATAHWLPVLTTVVVLLAFATPSLR